MTQPAGASTYHFAVEIVDPEITDAELHRRLTEALRNATAAFKGETGVEVDAKAEVQGAFSGVGEVMVILAVAFLTGAAEGAGKDFYTRYLAPRLRKMNLIPRRLRTHDKAGHEDD